MSTQPVLVWFRNDLRLTDHPALTAALARGSPVVAVFVFDPDAAGAWRRGGASLWWLHHALESLAASLDAVGSRLILRRGATADVLAALAAETAATALHFTRGYEPWARDLETGVKTRLEAAGLSVRRFGGALLREPEELRTKAGEPFKVYTPFWRALLALGAPPAPLPAPKKVPPPPSGIESDRLEDWHLLPSRPDWAAGLRETWTPGEDGATQRLKAFLSRRLEGYATTRNLPGVDGTSRLSPHLHFGEISPRTVWHRASSKAKGNPKIDGGLETYLKELAWREFSYHLLVHWPSLPEEPFKPEFAQFPWRDDAGQLRAWQTGQTGYPIVDAGMRELWHTGTMHNRVRMVTASFLVKHLALPWQAGEAWFWDTLVDADLASNAASWQWVAGSGADAAPYFRIFNPVTQGEKFDADARYVRRWVPEIAGLPDDVIHAPWTAPEGLLRAAGVTLGKTYPLPVVDHAAARQRALAGYQAIRAAK